jgi:hypothetical protein
MFSSLQNEDGGFLDTDNYRKRVLHKLARELQLPKLTFQVIRRTIATLAQKKGTIKDVQGVMRHSRTATTTDVYMQEIPGKRAIDDQLHQFGAEKIGCAEPEKNRKKSGFNRSKSSSSRRKPSARVTQMTQSHGREGVLRFRHMLDFEGVVGGPDRDRTDDLFHAMEARSQLCGKVGGH